MMMTSKTTMNVPKAKRTEGKITPPETGLLGKVSKEIEAAPPVAELVVGEAKPKPPKVTAAPRSREPLKSPKKTTKKAKGGIDTDSLFGGQAKGKHGHEANDTGNAFDHYSGAR